VVKKTHLRWYDCVHQNYQNFCTFAQTFDAVLYLNKCGCAPILNFSPQCPICSTAKGGISNRVFLAIFVTVFRGFCSPCSNNCKKRRVSSWPVHCSSDFCLSSAMQLFSSCICHYCLSRSECQLYAQSVCIYTADRCWVDSMFTWWWHWQCWVSLPMLLLTSSRRNLSRFVYTQCVISRQILQLCTALLFQHTFN